jgi:hypothetical protein
MSKIRFYLIEFCSSARRFGGRDYTSHPTNLDLLNRLTPETRLKNPVLTTFPPTLLSSSEKLA